MKLSGRGIKLAGVALGFGTIFLPACKEKVTPDILPIVATMEQRHPLTGQVLAVFAERSALLVDHAEIPGYMPRMTMEFEVGAGDLALAKVGASLRAMLVADEDGAFRLESVWWDAPVADSVVRQAAAALREETGIRGRKAYREVGEKLPDFALYNQEGAVASATQWRGKQVLLNFIFTRCPVATMCPLATHKMQQTQELAKTSGVPNLELVSITLDPEYDTPGVLKAFAAARRIDTANFTFLTGPEGAIKDLFKQLGILTEMKGGVLQHTLATILINDQGKIIWRVDGSGWQPEEFVAKMKR
jgi:protein SCO1